MNLFSGDYIEENALVAIVNRIEKLKKQKLKSFEFGFCGRFFPIK